jgi:PAS domain S-box-containing protein
LAWLLLLSLGNYAVNFAEWAAIAPWLSLDAWEDTLDLLSPMVWWFFLYACCQKLTSQRLRDTIDWGRRMEQAIRNSEYQLRTVLDNLPVLIFNIERDGNILLANERFEWLEAETRTSIYAFIPPDFDESFREAIRLVFEHAEPQAFEFQAHAPGKSSGSTFWYSCRLVPIEQEGHVVSAIFVATDVTDLKEAEASHREAEERFRTLVEHAPEAIFVFDVGQDRFVDCNENALRLFKLGREEMLESNLLSLSPPLQPDNRASAEAACALFEEALDGRAPIARWIHRDATGEEFPCEVRLVQLPAGKRRLVRGSVIVLADAEAS